MTTPPETEHIDINLGAPLPGSDGFGIPPPNAAIVAPTATPSNTGDPDMDRAMDAAITSLTGPGQAPPDAETKARALAQARTLLREKAAGSEGLRDLQNLTLSMGLPATRALFRHMVGAAGLRGAAKEEALHAIKTISPITEMGCMKVDFHNRLTGRADSAYLRLDRCPRTHNLDGQLNKLKAAVAEDKWQVVLQNLSHLLMIGRSVYANVARLHVGLIRKIFGLAETDDCARYLDLRVDPDNTTLYLDAAWPNRVGFYVSFEEEVAATD